MRRVAVFDCDGTLVDSQANIVRAMAETYARHALPAPDARSIRRIVGLSLREVMRALLPDADAALHASMTDDYRTAFQRLRAEGRLDPEPLYRGVRDGLEALAADGWLLAVATGKSDRGLDMILRHHDLTPLFVSLQTADRHPSKPHPAMLLAAIDEAGATPDAAVIIGDTSFDMAMGGHAGVRALGVDWGYHDAAELRAAGADAVARDMPHLLTLLAAGAQAR